MEPGDQIVVRTPDRRSYYGQLVEFRGSGATIQVVVRLDTGWVTTYPAHMVQPSDRDVGTSGANPESK